MSESVIDPGVDLVPLAEEFSRSTTPRWVRATAQSESAGIAN